MSDYPMLKEMGIQNPNQIDRYSVQTVDNTDILRVVYKRQKGSMLPESKRFRFPRVEKMTAGDGVSKENEIFYEISPAVHQAMAELDKIVHAKRDRAQQVALINEEIDKFQEETAHQIDYLRKLISELQ